MPQSNILRPTGTGNTHHTLGLPDNNTTLRLGGDDSMDHGKDDVQRKANLARIRENQRRSRARRKEYLQELESKFRQCEQSGVEASAEIQAAARKVVDENKRLRLLLRQTGFSDAQIDGVSNGSHLERSQSPNAVTELEGMLGKRRPYTRSRSIDPSNQELYDRAGTPKASEHLRSSCPLPAATNVLRSNWHPQPVQPTSYDPSALSNPFHSNEVTRAEQGRAYMATLTNSYAPANCCIQTDSAHRWQQWGYPTPLQYSVSDPANLQATHCLDPPVYTATDVMNMLRSDFGYGLGLRLEG